jgi:5-methylthioribose kinase
MMDPVYKALNNAFVFNLSLELAIVYNLPRFVDPRVGTDLTSNLLRSNVLYLETNSQRYELARFTNSEFSQIYRLSIVRQPHIKDDAFF